MEQRQRGSQKPIDPACGMHLIKRVFQKRFLGSQCRDLANCLEAALDATEAVAPVRKNPYIIQRSNRRRALAHDEARWEETLFCELKDPPPDSGAPWKSLLSYQVNLPNRKDDKDWGEIDLLGVSRQQLPLVVELKGPRSKESPAHMLIQVTAYAVALRKAWRSALRHEWAKKVAKQVPEELSVVELVCAAPVEYWRNWTGDTPRARTVNPDVWAAIAALREDLKLRGYPSVFVRLDHDGSPDAPKSIRVVEEQLPEGGASLACLRRP